MRNFVRLLTIHIITIVTLSAQVVTWDPVYFTENDSVTITFNAAEGSQGLKGYGGSVYAHAGLITSKSNTPSDWKYVVSDWAVNTKSKIKLSKIGTDLYTLKITPTVMDYYLTSEGKSLQSGETIEKLAFVFRNADGSRTGKTKDGGDIFIQLRSGISLIKPSVQPAFVELGDSVEVYAAASSNTDTLSLYVNNSLVHQVLNDTIHYFIKPSSTGRADAKVVASNANGVIDQKSFYYVVNPTVNVADLPAGVQPGINYSSNPTEVTLALYAPNKSGVYVIGDFSNWEVDSKYYMNRTPDGSTYWITLTGLNVYYEYAFQYLVDGSLRIADPYAEKILEGEDDWVPSSVYPNLKPYPKGKTSESVSIFRTAESEYNWKYSGYKRPAKTKLVIYELLIRDFVSTHSYQTLIDTLGYFEKLGINAIELMPINEFEGNESWGYNPSFYFAPDKYYGPKEKFQQFIDECHKRGIAVIMDIALNHTFGRSPFVRLYASGKYGPPTSENPWLNPIPKHDFNVGYDFNHESPQTKELFKRVVKHWINKYKIDGFRFDLSKGFTQKNSLGNVGLWGQYDQSRIDIWKEYADFIWNVNHDTYIILEHFADNSEEKVLADYGMMLWGKSNKEYNEATMGYHDGGKSNFEWISYKKRGWLHPHVVGYMESHDEERLMYKNLQYGNSNGSYDIKNLSTALDRMKLAGAFFFTIPGPKMIWEFGELGYGFSLYRCTNGTINENCRTSNKPIRWDYYSNAQRNKLFKVFSYLIKLKTDYDAFSTTNFSLDVYGSMKKIYLNHSSMNVTIVGNFGVSGGNTAPNFQHTGKWYDYFSGDSSNVSNPNADIYLEAGEFRIYTDKKLPTPESGLVVTDVKDFDTGILPDKYELRQNYPNPFNPSTTIRFSIPESAAGLTESSVQLKIYNALGSEVASLVNEPKSPGNYEVQFDASGLASGVYYYRISAGNFTATKKMLLLK